MTDVTKLQAVAQARYRGEEALEGFRAASNAWVESKMEPWVLEIEEAVMAALDEGFSVTDVARAYTVSGKTPNRNVIHAIKNKYRDENAPLPDYPFEWVPREVETARGKRTLYDIRAVLDNFGPDEISGTYVWRFDVATSTPDEVLTDQDPYPTSRFYMQALNRWVMMNPSPGDE